MAKNQFADKVAKAAARKKICPVCNTEINNIKMVNSYKEEGTANWKYGERFHKVCKCNEKAVLG